MAGHRTFDFVSLGFMIALGKQLYEERSKKKEQ